MTIRDDAIAAHEANRQSLVDEAAQHLLNTTLANPADGKPIVDPKNLTTVQEDHVESMFVFTGPNDDGVYLSVQPEGDGWSVYRVIDDGGWTAKPRRNLPTLADLGAVLAEEA